MGMLLPTLRHSISIHYHPNESFSISVGVFNFMGVRCCLFYLTMQILELNKEGKGKLLVHIYIIQSEGLCIKAKSRKNAIFATFASIHRPSLDQEKVFASKISHSDSPHVFTPRWIISRKKILNIFSRECPLLCSVF